MRIYLLINLVFIFFNCSHEDTLEPNSDPPLDSEKSDLIGDRMTLEQCSWNWQCSADNELICRPSSLEIGEPDYRCQLLGDTSEFCSDDDDCAHDYICKNATISMDGTLMTAGRCYDTNAEPCSKDIQCKDDRVCRPSTALNLLPLFQCLIKGEYNSTCAKDSDCIDDLNCDGVEFYANGDFRRIGRCQPSIF